jgi:galactose mutarotase-like enzyme
MSTHKILQPGASYSFHSYFNLPNDTDEILAEFAYSFTQARLQLPRSSGVNRPDHAGGRARNPLWCSDHGACVGLWHPATQCTTGDT